MARHQGLHSLSISDSILRMVDPKHTLLKQLLNRNRKIQGIGFGDAHDKVGYYETEIRKLYAFNRFFQDFAHLPMESLSLVPSLLGNALTGCASRDFRWSAFLMAYHSDALCQLVENSPLPSMSASEFDNIGTVPEPSTMESFLQSVRNEFFCYDDMSL
ncbi:hypothetical protein FisN_12Lu146 [Fistulifera solaris]|uniref:Uncharacterized protein n=1 Tax=Fistulifera solaris TaxID=1519565 RepID=A0A1Z5JML3_FISSO|nr:hypothetical protein FisN_12Lu146 [Fistulifera solaris]|eukprot:GAX15224.1 hypothetical protein FisN_12Lu146 [Fistulifera solaris]